MLPTKRRNARKWTFGGHLMKDFVNCVESSISWRRKINCPLMVSVKLATRKMIIQKETFTSLF